MAIAFTWITFYGVVDTKVYEKNPIVVNELKDYIYDAFIENAEARNLCLTVCQRVLERLTDCCNVGEHFERQWD